MSSDRLALAAALVALVPGAARAQWVWSKETGWVNPDYRAAENDRTLFARGKALLKTKKHQLAARVFERILKAFPTSERTELALYHAGEARYQAQDYAKAYDHLKKYMDRYPTSDLVLKVARRLYTVALAFLRGERKELWGWKVLSGRSQGRKILRQLVGQFPKSPFAPHALYSLATDSYLHEDYLEAMEDYKALRKNYPESEWRGASLYQIARCQLAQNEGIAYDIVPLLQARRTLLDYRRENPEGNQFALSGKAIGVVEEMLAEKHYRTGTYYLSKGKRRACRIYLSTVAFDYPRSSWARRARQIASRQRLKLQRPSTSSLTPPKEAE